MKTSTRIIGIVAAVVLSAALFAGGFLLGRSSLGLAGFGFNGVRGGNFGFGMLNRFGFGLGGVIPMILTILFWVIIIGAGIWLISSLGSWNSRQTPSNLPPTESALDILKKRYARGEITKEQFDAMSHEIAP
ncbi:MAG TPA: SHOCT domain-containing protein [Anaerolineae bacterium]|nr:SHOCT domain-containing protein [Anaerolineae bacterium]